MDMIERIRNCAYGGCRLTDDELHLIADTIQDLRGRLGLVEKQLAEAQKTNEEYEAAFSEAGANGDIKKVKSGAVKDFLEFTAPYSRVFKRLTDEEKENMDDLEVLTHEIHRSLQQELHREYSRLYPEETKDHE